MGCSKGIGGRSKRQPRRKDAGVIRGCSIETCNENYKRARVAGMSHEQAYAIVINTAKKYKKYCSIPRQKQIKEGKVFGEQ